MGHSKKIKVMAAALALVFALNANAAKQKEAPTVKNAVEKVNLAVKEVKRNSKPKATKLLNEALNILGKLPESEEVSEARGYCYRTWAEIELFFNKNVQAFEKKRKLCIENSKVQGAEVTYLAAGFYYDVADYFVKSAFQNPSDMKMLTNNANEYYGNSRKMFLEAFELDPELDRISGRDIGIFMNLSKLKSNFSDVASFYDKFFASKNTSYYKNLGANAMAIYEKTGEKSADNIHKAILISILDFEAMEKPNGDELLKILEENFSKYKDASPSIAFVRKFYSDAKFSQSDLDSLPAGVRDFLPVRYMYKMKTSDDTVELAIEFYMFFRNVDNYKKRMDLKGKAL